MNYTLSSSFRAARKNTKILMPYPFPFPIDMRFGVVRFLAWFELSLQKSRRGQRD